MCYVCFDLLDAAWGLAVCMIIVSLTWVCRDGIWFGLVSLGLHCFLQLPSAELIVVLVPSCCWAYSAFSV